MRADLAPRILALPADIRAALARVEGPGWYVFDAPRTETKVSDPLPWAPNIGGLPSGFTEAWWPANPAAAVAAVLGEGLWFAHDEISNWLHAQYDNARGKPNDDHAAAIAIIEAHASRSTP